MNKQIYISIVLVFFSLLWSCDDGNIITTTFNFDEETDLSLCQQNGINVLYFIDPDTNEAISFEFSVDDFDGTFFGDIGQEVVEFEIPINTANRVVYRRLSASANGSDYFCQQVPPSSPQVLEEFISSTGGTATFSIRISEEDDNDGVPAEIEGVSSDDDGDGIPNFLDADDDNDNVLTSAESLEPDEEDEFVVEVNGVLFVDTDNDGIPNFLDDDDDGDEILTRYEDLNVCEDPEVPTLNPSNDTNVEGLPNYLNQTATESNPIDIVRNHEVIRSFFTELVFNDITFNNQNNSESLSFTSFIMGRYTVSNVDQILTLDLSGNLISEEEAGNFCQ